LLRDSRQLAELARAASETLEGALDLAEGCGGRSRGTAVHTSKLLTARESQILQLISAGLTDVNIASRLSISEQTVGTHLRKIYRKLGVHSRTEAVARLSS
jgi:DNA-binding NarL/FixJ family response regulator